MQTIVKVFVILVAKVSLTLASSCTTKSGLVGICKPITECFYLTELLSASGDFSDLTPCNSNGTVGVFCCPLNHLSVNHSVLSKPCQRIMELNDSLKPSIVRLTKSTLVSFGELPFIAQIIFPEKGFVGTGALVSEKFVLTAAHVVYIRKSMPTVRLGKVRNNSQSRRLLSLLLWCFYFLTKKNQLFRSHSIMLMECLVLTGQLK